MGKLLKRLLIGTAVLAGVGFLLFGTSFQSYVRTAYHEVRKRVKDSVPIEFELKRARRLIERIDPEIMEARREVARAEVAMENLEEEIAALEKSVAQGKKRLAENTVLLENGGKVRLAAFGKTWSRREIELRLCRAFDAYRNQVELLKSKKALVERQRKVLEAARTKLAAVRAEKAKLEDLVEALEAKKRQIDAMAATARRFDLDTSSLGEARKVLEEVRNRLDVTQKIIQEELFFTTGVDTGPAEERDILSEIHAYFGGEDRAHKPRAAAVRPAETAETAATAQAR